MTEPTERAAQGESVATSVTFDELVQHGIDNGANIVRGVPWFFTWRGFAVTHENDDLYLICHGAKTVRFHRGQLLYIAVGTPPFTERPLAAQQEEHALTPGPWDCAAGACVDWDACEEDGECCEGKVAVAARPQDEGHEQQSHDEVAPQAPREAQAVEWPKVWGTSRMHDNSKALLVMFDSTPTDDQLRNFDETIKGRGLASPAPEGWAAQVARDAMSDDPQPGDWNAACEHIAKLLAAATPEPRE